MEVKTAPPVGKEGWEWLVLRISMREVRSGRFDFQILIADEDGEVVAICRHRVFIVGAETAHKRRLAEGVKI